MNLDEAKRRCQMIYLESQSYEEFGEKLRDADIQVKIALHGESICLHFDYSDAAGASSMKFPDKFLCK